MDKRLIIALVFWTLAFFFLFVFRSTNPEGPSGPSNEKEVMRTNDAAVNKPLIPPKGGPDEKVSSSKEQKISVTNPPMKAVLGFAKDIFKLSSKEQLNLKKIEEKLDQMDVRHHLKWDRNPYTGGLAVVRSEELLDGLRYLHIQLTEEMKREKQKDGEETIFLDHLSFEIGAGPNQFSRVRTMVEESFELGKMLPSNNPRVRVWQLSASHIIWIQELTAEELRHHPFNTYSSSDVGVIKVVLELDRHR